MGKIMENCILCEYRPKSHIGFCQYPLPADVMRYKLSIFNNKCEILKTYTAARLMEVGSARPDIWEATKRIEIKDCPCFKKKERKF